MTVVCFFLCVCEYFLLQMLGKQEKEKIEREKYHSQMP